MQRMMEEKRLEVRMMNNDNVGDDHCLRLRWPSTVRCSCLRNPCQATTTADCSTRAPPGMDAIGRWSLFVCFPLFVCSTTALEQELHEEGSSILGRAFPSSKLLLGTFPMTTFENDNTYRNENTYEFASDNSRVAVSRPSQSFVTERMISMYL